MGRHAEFGYWTPHDKDRWCGDPEVGDLVAYDFKPWRVIAIRRDRPVPEQHNPEPGETCVVYQLRPPDVDSVYASKDKHIGWRKWTRPDKINEHYGLCVHCGELLPCRAIMAERAAASEAKDMKRYETPGVCPCCQEPVTHRQKSETFPNVVVPLGPPVTFHARKRCRYSMERYRERCAQPESQLRLDGGHL